MQFSSIPRAQTICVRARKEILFPCGCALHHPLFKVPVPASAVIVKKNAPPEATCNTRYNSVEDVSEA